MTFNPPPGVADRRLNQLAVKGSHNSYANDHGWTVVDMLSEPPAPPYAGRCRAVELDIVQRDDDAEWCVWHDYPYQADPSIQLRQYLADLVKWSSDQQGDHDPVFIHFDCKAGGTQTSDFPGKFDAYVGAALAGVQLLRPRDLMGQAASLRAAALDAGWPLLSMLRGRFIPILTGDAQVRRAAYLTGNQADRLCFVDFEIDLRTPASWTPQAPSSQLVVNIHGCPNLDGFAEWRSQFADRRAVLVRVYEICDEDTWNVGRQVGANILSTDDVAFSPWATVGSYPFAPA